MAPFSGPIQRSWLSPVMYESYVTVKRTEIDIFNGADAGDMFKRYHDVY